MKHKLWWLGGSAGLLILAALLAWMLFVSLAYAAPGAHGPGGEHLDAPGAAVNASGLARLPDGSVNVPKAAQRRMAIRTLLAPESEASFPSGHVLVVTTVAFVVLGLAWAGLSRAGRVAATTVAVTVTLAIALDRLVVGAHWLTDVTGSLALAAVIVSVVLAAHRLLQPEA